MLSPYLTSAEPGWGKTARKQNRREVRERCRKEGEDRELGKDMTAQIFVALCSRHLSVTLTYITKARWGEDAGNKIEEKCRRGLVKEGTSGWERTRQATVSGKPSIVHTKQQTVKKKKRETRCEKRGRAQQENIPGVFK
ncbi:unnamed protein product [Pleuronectes platessa]|uniref:Uncharacterized protein n=1 Tax=Pleuronectes platessa TaxID=8262 RepID=A0A9N7W219_PLEPL|nr:unnamed protein product [Pleuronectes platessa]